MTQPWTEASNSPKLIAPLCQASYRAASRRVACTTTRLLCRNRRLYLRLAHRWRWLNDGQYEHVSRLVAEIGRLLGGWLKNPPPAG